MAGRRWADASGRRPKRFASLDGDVQLRTRRLVAGVLAALGLVGLVVLLLSPTFQVHRVVVLGSRHVSPAQVVATAGLRDSRSIFLVDPAGVERRLAGSTWIRSASVSARLPDQVSITVEEWQPVAVYRAPGAPPFYLSDQAVALGPADDPGAGSLLQVNGPAQPAPRAGRTALDPRLLTNMVNIQRVLPGLIGQQVKSFSIDSCGDLVLDSQRGWEVQFGRVLTPEEFTALRTKLAALRSLQAAGDVDFDNPRLQYVNVMNPASVAVEDGTVRPSPNPGRRAPTPAPTPPPASCR